MLTGTCLENQQSIDRRAVGTRRVLVSPQYSPVQAASWAATHSTHTADGTHSLAVWRTVAQVLTHGAVRRRVDVDVDRDLPPAPRGVDMIFSSCTACRVSR